MTDTHIAAAAIFEVPEGQDAKAHFAKFYEIVKKGGQGCLYYGFATSGQKVLCREGYKNAEAFLIHAKEVKEPLEALIKQVGKERVKIMCSGPPAELAKIKPNMDERMPIWYIDLDAGAIQPTPFPAGGADTHLSVLAEFAVPSGKMGDATALFPKAYATTKGGAGAAGCLYYGFGATAESVLVREGYKNAAAALAHGADVKEMAEEIAKKAAGVKINVVGPKAEIDQLRPKLEPRGAIFWELDASAFWK